MSGDGEARASRSSRPDHAGSCAPAAAQVRKPNMNRTANTTMSQSGTRASTTRAHAREYAVARQEHDGDHDERRHGRHGDLGELDRRRTASTGGTCVSPVLRREHDEQRARASVKMPNAIGAFQLVTTVVSSAWTCGAAAWLHGGRLTSPPPPSGRRRERLCAARRRRVGQPEDRAHERRRGDEQHDERLHDEHDVDRHALGGLHREAAGLERAEQDAGDEDAPRRRATEQRHRDRVEADAGVDARGESGGHGAEHLADAGEADERTRR